MGWAHLSRHDRLLSGRKRTVRFRSKYRESGRSPVGILAAEIWGLYSNVDALRQRQCVVNINAKIADRALNLAVTQKDLNCSKVPGSFVDHRSLGPAQRMSSVLLGIKPDDCHPFADKPSILPGAEVSKATDPARKQEVVERSLALLQPSSTGCCEHLP